MEPENEKAPLFKNWNQWYVFVIVFLVLLILFLYLFAKHFS